MSIETDLAELLHPGAPFGPVDAADVSSRGVSRRLYLHENQIDYEVRRMAPTFLIGRRGSGKTAVLRSTYPEGELDVDLNIATMLVEVGRCIDRLDLSGRPAEVLPSLWKAAFTAALCARVHSDFCQLEADDCPSAFKFGELNFESLAGAATDVAGNYLEAVVAGASDDSVANLDRHLDKTELNGVPLWKARAELESAAKRVGCKAVVSADSLDHYDKLLYAGGALVSPEALALQSLYRAASSTARQTSSVYKVRVSFPAELWHFYNHLSENPMKDFDNIILLHWNGSELLSLLATRMLTFLRIHKPKDFSRLPATAGPGLGKGKHAASLLSAYLPQQIENGLGGREPTLPYFLRHTQLLPRHLILILNHVFRDRGFGRDRVSAEEVRDSVRSAEKAIALDIVDSYRVPYPHLEDVCDYVVPRLALRFTYSELAALVRQSGRAGQTVDEAVEMLIEVGAIGRIREVSSRYVKGDFEYLHEGKLRVTENDELCLHPVFAGSFKSPATLGAGGEGNARAIYPWGADFSVDSVRQNVNPRAT